MENTFLQHFSDVIEDELFIGTSTQDLQQEIEQNMWRLSKPHGFNESIQDWLNLINRIIDNRKQQVRTAGHSMIFYLWFDEQACQLRFNLINQHHKFLPFQTNIEFIPSFQKIVESFWTSPYHEGIPFDELSDDTATQSTVDSASYVLQVYKQELIPES